MRRTVLLIGLCIALVVTIVIAQEAITVSRAVVCTGVVDREPAGEAAAFADSIATLYCFTELDGAEGQVVHAWYHGDKMMAEVTLNKKAGRWRTWSNKKMVKEWTGTWRVDIKDVTGAVLKSVNFEYGK